MANGGEIHVIVVRMSSTLDLDTVLEDAFTECGSEFDALLEAGEVKPPVTLRFIDSNARCFADGLISDLKQRPEIRLFRQEEIDWPLFFVLGDSQGNKLIVRIELDRETTF